MKKLSSTFLVVTIMCVTLSSCLKQTYTEGYQFNLRIDGIDAEKVSILYLGNPIVNDFKVDGNAATVPYSAEMFYQHDSKKPLFAENEQLYNIKNTSSGDIYVFYILFNDGNNPVKTDIQKDKYSRQYLTELFHIYRKEDSNPNFTPSEEIEVYAGKFEKYIPREELYDDLISLGYPYIKKLEPEEEFIARWGLEWE